MRTLMNNEQDIADSDHEAIPVSEELEAELLRALRTPARETTPADWDAKRRRLIERHRQAKAGDAAPRKLTRGLG